MKQAYRRKEKSARGLLLILADFCASSQIVLVLVVVLVLESGHAERWSDEVLDYCAKSELHPRSGFGFL